VDDVLGTIFETTKEETVFDEKTYKSLFNKYTPHGEDNLQYDTFMPLLFLFFVSNCFADILKHNEKFIKCK